MARVRLLWLPSTQIQHIPGGAHNVLLLSSINAHIRYKVDEANVDSSSHVESLSKFEQVSNYES